MIGGLITNVVIQRFVKKYAGPLVTKVLQKKGLGPIVDILQDVMGTDTSGIEQNIKNNPEQMVEVLLSVEETHREALQLAQIDAEHASLFVAGARPAAIWVCVLIIGWAGICIPAINWIAQIVGIIIKNSDIPAIGFPPTSVFDMIKFVLPIIFAVRASEGIMGVKRDSL